MPVALKNLDGLDSLCQLFRCFISGVPVAAVAVDNARNAGLLAVRILGASDEGLRKRMVDFQQELHAVAKARANVYATRSPHTVRYYLTGLSARLKSRDRPRRSSVRWPMVIAAGGRRCMNSLDPVVSHPL